MLCLLCPERKENSLSMAEKDKKDDIIIGRNAVAEALRSGRTVDSILVARGDRSGTLGKIIGECRERGIVVKEADARKLDYLCGHSNHQGIVAFTAVHEYASIEDILATIRFEIRAFAAVDRNRG